MAKANEIDKWAVELEPKQLWTVAAGAEAKSFYMVEPEIWVPVTLRCPWAASMGVRRGGKTGICPSLEIGTEKQKFPENVNQQFNSD